MSDFNCKSPTLPTAFIFTTLKQGDMLILKKVSQPYPRRETWLYFSYILLPKSKIFRNPFHYFPVFQCCCHSLSD